MTRGDAALLFLAALLARVAALLAFPGLHGDDAAARLAYADRLVLAYQLPLPQAIVVLVRAIAPHPFWTQLAFATIGSAVAPALGAVVARLESPLAGRLAGAWAATHPLLLYYSLVPYQEGPMLAALLAGAWALLRGRDGLAGLFLGLAALCRYEAWIAAAVVVARRRSLRALIVFGWAPLGWMAFWGGLSPRGTYVVDLDPTAGRLQRLAFLTGKAVEYSGGLAVTLAAAGTLWVLARGDRRWRTAGAFTLAFLIAAVLAAHEFPPGSGRVSERLIHLPVVGLCAAAGVAIARAAGHRAMGAVAAAAVVVLVAASWLLRTGALVEAARREPAWTLARAVAGFVEPRLGASGRLAVAGPAVPPAAIEDYVRKVEEAGGDAVRARQTARAFSRLSPDAVRVAAHLARPAGSVVPPAEPAAFLAVFDDAVATPPGRVLARFEAPPRRALIYEGSHVAGPH